MESNLRPVRPVVPVAPYIGGKRNLARRLVALIAATPHTTYAEPFVGMGGVFLRRTSRPTAEAIGSFATSAAVETATAPRSTAATSSGTASR